MKKRLLIISLTTICVFILIFSDYGDSKKVKIYNCDTATWNLDTPVDVKEKCFRLKKELIFKDQKNYI